MAGARGALEQKAVRETTRGYYAAILKRFMAFASRLGGHQNDDGLDALLVDFCDCQFFEGYPGSMGSKLQAALADEIPRYSKHGAGKLPRFYRALQAWNRLAPGETRDPLPWLHVVGLVATMVA